MRGRGLLGKWGPNHAADPIVTRFHPETGVLQLVANYPPSASSSPNPDPHPSPTPTPTPTPTPNQVAILRADVQRWALPGGMVEAGQGISATIRRDFEAEVGDHDDPEEKATMSRLLDALFAGIDDDEGLGGHHHLVSRRLAPRLVYRGYVDDPRNTDNAWIETSACLFHCTEELGATLTLKPKEGGGSDAAEWINVSEDEPRFSKFMAAHKPWVARVRG